MKAPKPGIYLGVPEAEYFNWEAVSKSALSDFAKNAGKYKLCTKKETTAMKLGKAIDKVVFDGEEVMYNEFAIMPKFSGKGSAKAKDEWKKEYKHLTHISQQEHDNVTNAAKAVKENSLAMSYIKNSHFQMSMVWIDEETGLTCKARPDIKPQSPVIVDLKSTQDVSYSKIRKIYHDLKYYWQAEFYCQGWEAITGEEIEKFTFIFVEREYPHQVEVYTADEDSRELAKEELASYLLKYKHCQDSDIWPLSSGEERIISLPKYAYYQ